MSGGSQHNSNGRQSQLGAGWSPLQLQVANLLARAPQAHMGSERGLTWHTPTAPPHLYHVPAPSPPEHLQAIKNSGSNSVFRHTATPPELYRHTPTPPDKHLMRHTPSPGDAKPGAAIPPPELYSHLGPSRDKLVRPEDLLAAYARGGVDLTLGGPRSANGAAPSPAPPAHPAHPALPASPALSVRDAPTINSLIARAQPRHPHTKFEAILERLVPSPVSPHSVIVHSRAAPTPTPSPPSSNEDSVDSCGGPASKRKRKPERTLRVPTVPLPPAPPLAAAPPPVSRVSPPRDAPPVENGDSPHQTQNGPDPQKPPSPRPPEPHTRRKTRSGSAETIDDIAAMIASTDRKGPPTPPEMAEVPMDIEPEIDVPVTVDKLKSVLASPEPSNPPNPVTIPDIEKKSSPSRAEEKDKQMEPPVVEAATAPRRRSARTSNSESTNVPVESPSEAKPAEPEAGEGPAGEPATASFVEVENQLEMMFAGIEETAKSEGGEPSGQQKGRAKKRRKSTAAKCERKVARRASRASACEEGPRRKPTKKKEGAKAKKAAKEPLTKDAYDSGSNASSSRSRGPFIQIRGRRDSPLCVSVVNAGGAAPGAAAGEDEERRRPDEFRNGLRVRGLHASTLGLRYDATTPDATWVCAFCERGPHAGGLALALGDLFGPYALQNDCDEYRALDEATRRRYSSSSEVWFHESCAVWAPGLVAAGARVWGLAGAVWAARGARCAHCGRAGAALACAAHACRARAHHPCALDHQWRLDLARFGARCPRHAAP